jgi:hypothetical protein
MFKQGDVLFCRLQQWHISTLDPNNSLENLYDPSSSVASVLCAVATRYGLRSS